MFRAVLTSESVGREGGRDESVKEGGREEYEATQLFLRTTGRGRELFPPAVDHQRTFGWPMLLHDSPVEGQDGCGVVWHAVVRPGREVELGHLHSTL